MEIEKGTVFNELTVLSKCDYKIRNRLVWHCKCSCGKEIDVIGTDLRTNRKKNCGHIHQNGIDERGHRYGRLLVIEQDKSKDNKYKGRHIRWKCKCDCGNIVSVNSGDLRSGKIKSCGCYSSEVKVNRAKDEIGNRYGRLTVIEKAIIDNKVFWKCKCECGNIKYVRGSQLRLGRVKSCGCVHSINNAKIKNFLEEQNVSYKEEVCFQDLKSTKNGYPRFDFGVYKDNELLFLIEYQGEQHYVDKPNFGVRQREETDALKKEYCKKNNIPLLVIPFIENEEDYKKRILDFIMCPICEFEWKEEE